MHGEGRQRETVIAQLRLDLLLPAHRAEHLGGLEEGFAGVPADRQLDRVEIELRAVQEHLVEVEAGEERRHHA